MPARLGLVRSGRDSPNLENIRPNGAGGGAILIF